MGTPPDQIVPLTEQPTPVAPGAQEQSDEQEQGVEEEPVVGEPIVGPSTGTEQSDQT